MATLQDILTGIPTRRSPLSHDEATVLLEATRRYPYFLMPARVLLRWAPRDFLDTDTVTLLQNRIALSRQTAAYSVNAASADTEILNTLHPKLVTENTPETTEDVISTFLQTYGSTSPEEEEMLERLIFNPTPDYGELLAREEQANLPDGTAPAGTQDSLIEAFILREHPAIEHPASAEDPQPEPEIIEAATPHQPEHHDQNPPLLSESLAKMFIKQGRYQRAYEIISNLSLNFPKKSIYFADQLRYLQKLIYIQQHRAPES